MKTSKPKQYLCIPAVVGVAAILGTASADAAFVNVPDNTPETPGILLGGGSTVLDTGAGTVLASQEQSWSSTLIQGTFSGTLRSMVVDSGGGYDFYYQVLNTSTGGTNVGMDIFRLAIPGYSLTDPLNPVDATYRTDGLVGLVGVPVAFLPDQLSNKGVNGAVYSADRDPALDAPEFFGGGAAFDFDPSQLFNLAVPGGPTTAPQNIEAGERSNWLVLRTNYSAFNVVDSAILSGGNDTGLASTFAPIPEPSTVLFGLAMFGVCAGGRLRKSRSVQ